MPRSRAGVHNTPDKVLPDTPATGKRKRDTPSAVRSQDGKGAGHLSLKDSPKSSPRGKRTLVVEAKREREVSVELEANGDVTASITERSKAKISKSPRQGAKGKPAAVEVDSDSESEATTTKKPKQKRKTKEEKEAEMLPLAARSANCKYFVGAHTSIAKGVENAITNAVHIGGNAFACFLKSQRKWDNPALKDENRDAFRSQLIIHKYDTKHIVPHGSYLVNLATGVEEMAAKSYAAFIDDLHRCEALGILYYNFHPGGAGPGPLQDAIQRLANNLNRALSETKTVTPLLENMAGHGTLIGGRFTDLRDVIALIKPEYKHRIGVCIDTCHAFAAGYDLRTLAAFAKTMAEFDEVVGLQYLKALHLNDSKAPLSSHRDLHQNIGLGFLGLRAFHNVMNFGPFENLPLILETPCEKPDPKDPKGKKMVEDKSVWAKEIKLLESLIGMDPESAEFKQLEKELAGKGQKERAEMQRKFDEKEAKEKKKLAKEKEKGQQSLTAMFGKPSGKGNAKVKAKKPKNGDDEEESELSSLSESE